MNTRLLLFILMVFLLPHQAMADRSCKLHIEYSFYESANESRELSGFRLYKEGEKICEVKDPSSRAFDCQFISKRGGFNFTLAPFYSDTSEGLHSPAYRGVVGKGELIVLQSVINLLLTK
ncbi:MAG: hypothetical protein GY705_32085 [Bacteroidetes bacterium]|nr:hypothetical protein [Bacteroidota bacterium]